MSEQEVFNALKYRVVVNEHGTREYYNKDDQLHRTDGPAVIWDDGTELWCQHGLLHRTDGPAIIWNDGVKEWWLGGRQLTEDEFNQAIDPSCNKR